MSGAVLPKMGSDIILVLWRLPQESRRKKDEGKRESTGYAEEKQKRTRNVSSINQVAKSPRAYDGKAGETGGEKTYIGK